ncbi:MAG: hypothetical protein ABJL99_09800 [Aliishimia sp.]
MLEQAASVASETGVTMVIERAGKVYKIMPPGQSYLLTASEKDDANCDAAFGTSN